MKGYGVVSQPVAANPGATGGPTSRSYFSQRLRMRYVDWGNPGAPPLLLVHGGRDHSRNWDWVAQRLRHKWHIIAPDLRGHGDSQWVDDGNYTMTGYVYDLAQLIHEQDLAPVTILAHSLGGMISLRYTGTFPEKVRKIVAIEGLGAPPVKRAERAAQPLAERMRIWIETKRGLAGRLPRRYPSIEEACRRMQAENARLTPEQARHLTEHGVNQNEDGSYSWKFDNYIRAWAPYDLDDEDIAALWSRITCPTLLIHGKESWDTNPLEDGRAAHFNNAEVVSFDGAGHWVHHDQLDRLLAVVEPFLA